ncbi:MAG: cyanoexosortase A [Elainellaceae cyanobacterium]
MLTIPRSIPLGVAVGLAAIYLAYVWQLGDKAHWGMSIIFGLAILSLLWDRTSQKPESQTETPMPRPLRFAVGLGVASIAAILALSIRFSESEVFIRLMPPMSGIGVALLAAGFRGLMVYWQELALLFFLGVPGVVFSLIQDISPITARFSALLLWYVGFDPQVNGVYLMLGERAIEVWEGCSGAESICYMIGIAAVCLALYPVKSRLFQVVAILAAAFLGFLINGIRVALMAFLISKENIDAFLYWHEGDGSLLFGIGSVVLFGLIYWPVSRLLAEPVKPSPDQDAAY